MVCLNVQRKYSSFAVKQEVFFSCFSTPDYARHLIFFVSFVLFCAFLCFNRDQIKLDLQQTWPWLRLIMSGCHASLIRSMTLVLTLRYLINVITRHQEKRKEDIKSLVTCPRLLPKAEFEVRNDRFFFLTLIPALKMEFVYVKILLYSGAWNPQTNVWWSPRARSLSPVALHFAGGSFAVLAFLTHLEFCKLKLTIPWQWLRDRIWHQCLF